MAYRAYLRTDRLRALCDARGMTVTTLAEALDMHPSSAYRVLRGAAIPSNELIAGCAVVFGADRLGELLHFVHADQVQRPRRFAPVALPRSEEIQP